MKRIIPLLLSLTLGAGTAATIPVKAANKYTQNSTTALEVAEEGMILLKNSGTLPFKTSDRIGSYGSYGIGPIYGGGGSGWVNTNVAISYSAGLTAAANAGYIASHQNTSSVSKSDSIDKVVFYIGRESTEAEDNSESDYYLTTSEKSNLSQIVTNYGKDNVVVVLNTPSVIDTTYLLDLDVGAIVAAYYGGEIAGTALANVLTGITSPSGHTVDTWAASLDDYPTTASFGAQAAVEYTEDLYLGYRYFSTFDPNSEKVNFCFGHGLSYTDFSISEVDYKEGEDTLTISAKVTNTGSTYSGKQVLQLYIGQPQAKLDNPKAILMGYAKTQTLAPGESEVLTLEVAKDDLAELDDMGIIQEDAYVLEEGEFSIYLGFSLDEALKNQVAAYTNSSEKIVKTVTHLDSTLETRITNVDGVATETAYQTLDKGTSNKTVSAYGSSWIQAEDYDEISTGATSEVYYSGLAMGKGVGNLNIAERYVSYNLKVEKAGTYNIGFVMASAWAGQNDMFDLYVNGTEVGFTVSMNATHTDSDSLWFKGTYLKSTLYSITLPAGDVTLKFVGNGTNFMNFDAFCIYNSDINPSDVTTLYGCNTYIQSKSPIQTVDEATSGIIESANSHLTYRVNAEQAGTYDMRIFASNVTAATSDAYAITVNGTAVDQQIALSRTATGGDNTFDSNYYEYEESDTIKVDLVEGTNTIKIAMKDANPAIIQKVALKPYVESEAKVTEFVDNTDDFTYRTDLEGTKLEDELTYVDVLQDRDLMDDFLSQLSIEDLAYLAGDYTSTERNNSGTGSFGGLMRFEELYSRYLIPSCSTADGPAGIRYTNGDYATFMPCLTLLACTWNTQLAQDYGEAVAAEGISSGTDMWLAPGANIHTNPLGGRNFEYCSEDPYVTGTICGNLIRAAQAHGLSVSLKHFVCNNQETNRFNVEVKVSERAWRQIYLKGFELAIKIGDPHSIMTSYNLVNGSYNGDNSTLLNDVVRDEFGFDGIYISDWGAFYTNTAMVLAQCNIKANLPEPEELVKAYQCNILSRDALELNAEQIIEFLLDNSAGTQSWTMLAKDEDHVGATVNQISLDSYQYKTKSIDDVTANRYIYGLSVYDDGDYKISISGTEGFVYRLEDGTIVKDGDVLSLEYGKFRLYADGINNLELTNLSITFEYQA